MKETISLETALTVIGNLKVLKIKTLNSCLKLTLRQKETLREEIEALKHETKCLYKNSENDNKAIFDKIIQKYSPELKKYYSKNAIKAKRSLKTQTY